MRRFFKNNGLSLVLFSLFAVCWVGQTLAGFHTQNEERAEHGQPATPFREYLSSGQQWEATAENWESEFLQMAAFVWLTVYLRQKGSPESKKLEGAEDNDREPRSHAGAPWPVRFGGIAKSLYSRSLGLALAGLFLFSFSLHAVAGARELNEDRERHGQAPITTLAYLKSSKFWFESFQNWQSEFLSVGALVVLGIFLRHKGSPESKPVDAAHAETGR